MPPTVLSVASRAVLAACERLGLDRRALLDAVGLAPGALDDVDARISATQADALWQAAYLRAGDPHLALHAAAALPLGAYKVIDYLGSSSATVGEALGRLAAYFEIVDTRARLVVSEGTSFEVALVSANAAPIPQGAQEYSLTAIVTRLRAMAEPFELADVAFAFPSPADASEHARVLGRAPRFDAPHAAIRLGPAAWRAPIRSADPALASILEAHAARLVAELPKSAGAVSSRVTETVLDLVRARRPIEAVAIAKTLAMSTRTLHRRLREEDTELGRVVDEARAAAARAHLDDRALSIAEVSWLLGFADQSTFGRAFKRWTGMSPATWRRRGVAAGARAARPSSPAPAAPEARRRASRRS